MANRVYALSLRATVGWLIAIIVLFGLVTGVQQQQLSVQAEELDSLVREKIADDKMAGAVSCKEQWERQAQARQAWVEVGGAVAASGAVAVGRVAIGMSDDPNSLPADLLDQLSLVAQQEAATAAEKVLDENYPEPSCDLKHAEKVLEGR